MDDNIRAAFDKIHMQDECISRIENAVHSAAISESKPAHGLRRKLIALATVFLLVMLIVVSNADVVQAVEQVIEDVISAVTSVQDRHVKESYTFLDGNLKSEDYVDSEGNRGSSGEFILANPIFLMELENRLYFTANGEKLDITELISMEIPFLYTYTDEEMFTHYYAVGITVPDADNILEQVGWSYWVQDAEKAKESYHGSWITGCSAGHYSNRMEKYMEWYLMAKEEFNVPWS